jgi:hypothetical protein
VVRTLLGVSVVKGETGAGIDGLEALQADMVSAMQATLRAIPDAKRILELQIEELMQRLEDVENEGKRIVAAAKVLGVELPEP